MNPGWSRDPQAGTTAVDDRYVQLTTIHGRDYQKFSIDHGIHMVPVDEVGSHKDSGPVYGLTGL